MNPITFAILIIIFTSIFNYSIYNILSRQKKYEPPINIIEEREALTEGFIQSFVGVNNNPYPEENPFGGYIGLHDCYEDGYKAGMKLQSKVSQIKENE